MIHLEDSSEILRLSHIDYLFFSDSIAIDLDQIEAEVENEANEEDVNFEVNWRNDFEELEKALEDDSGKPDFIFR